MFAYRNADANGQADRPLFKTLTQYKTNRPHCLYRRPAIRQARKPANDRENPVRLIESERLEPCE